MIQQKKLIVIGGPTASGKTGVAIKVAQELKTEVLSADSRQFYKEMTIGTAKPTAIELAAVPHHFVDFISVRESFTVGDFEREALDVLDNLFQTKDTAVLTGGSGLYIRALCEGLDKFPEVKPEIRSDLNNRFEQVGIGFLQKELEVRDPEYYKIVDISNPQRLIRALEVCISSGLPYSGFRKGAKVERPFQIIYIQLEWEREKLYNRINQRVELMLEMGLIDEARSLFPLKDLNALQTVGYQELFDYFDDKIPLEEAIELIKRNSRRYAKRQLTWLRRDGFWKGFGHLEIEKIMQYIQERI